MNWCRWLYSRADKNCFRANFQQRRFFSNFVLNVFIIVLSLWDIHCFLYNRKWWRYSMHMMEKQVKVNNSIGKSTYMYVIIFTTTFQAYLKVTLGISNNLESAHIVKTRKYLLRGYIQGVLMHTTGCDRHCSALGRWWNTEVSYNMHSLASPCLIS